MGIRALPPPCELMWRPLLLPECPIVTERLIVGSTGHSITVLQSFQILLIEEIVRRVPAAGPEIDINRPNSGSGTTGIGIPVEITITVEVILCKLRVSTRGIFPWETVR